MDTWINVETGLISPFIRCEKKLMWLPILYQIKVFEETYIFLSCPWNSRYFWRSFPWKQRVQKISLYKYRDNTYIWKNIYERIYNWWKIDCDYNSECGTDSADAMTRVRAVRLRSNWKTPIMTRTRLSSAVSRI